MKTRLPLVIAYILLMTCASARAQTETAFDVNGAAEILFPQVIRFSADLSIPVSDVEAVELTIEAEGRDPVALDLDPEAIAEGETRFVYLWDIPVDDPPILFNDITYRWTVEAADGASAEFEDSLTFTDPRADFAQVVGAEGRFSIAVSGGASRAGRLRQSLQPVYDLLVENTGRQPDSHWMIYEGGLIPGCETDEETGERVALGVASGIMVPCSRSTAEAIYAASGVQVIEAPAGIPVETAVARAMARDFYAPLWEGAAVPAWFAAGLEQFYTTAPKANLLPVVRDAARTNRLYTLPRLSGERSDDPVWGAQSYGMILYIVDQIGAQGLFDLARDFSAGELFDTVLERHVGVSMTALLPAWQNWIFTRDAESAYGITPYQPPTGTPTPSNTPTPTPPPTSTETRTPTATNTVYVTPARTPFPTVTPSRTPSPRPPSVTPRPPGSLETPTPVPQSALPGIVADQTTQAIIIAVLLIVLAVLVGLYIRLSRR